MTKIKLCGLKRLCDIAYVNELAPDYIGFVFAKESRRYVSPEEAKVLRSRLQTGIVPVGVFVDEEKEQVAKLVKQNIIEAVQLHGQETEEYIQELRTMVSCPIIKAFRMESRTDVAAAKESLADYVLLDSGGGSGATFDWSMLKEMNRPYFLAGGLTSENVSEAIKKHQPFAVDASSSLETGGVKDRKKMTNFVQAVRENN
ncbi:MAG: phosphoribosylanthranilate isomerase [Lachnospiraceae bacterium]|nr:phosphoribosylanthranilate isomerase [Lachnospiraceae bacterium]